MDGKELNMPSIEIRLLSVAALAILSFNDTIFPSLSICLKVKQHENIVKTKNIEITKLNRLENLNAVNYLGKEINSKIKLNIATHSAFPESESSSALGTLSLPNNSISKLGIVVLKIVKYPIKKPILHNILQKDVNCSPFFP